MKTISIKHSKERYRILQTSLQKANVYKFCSLNSVNINSNFLNHLVLFEQEGEQHQHSSIVDNPPHIDVAICEAFMVAWVKGHIFGDHQSQVGSCGAANCIWAEMTAHWLRRLHI